MGNDYEVDAVADDNLVTDSRKSDVLSPSNGNSEPSTSKSPRGGWVRSS